MVGDLKRGLEHGALRESEDVRSNDDAWQGAGPWGEVVQLTDQGFGRKQDPNLLLSLAGRCCEEVGVIRVAAASRERHLARPRVAGHFSPTDEEGLKIAAGGHEDQRNCRLAR